MTARILNGLVLAVLMAVGLWALASFAHFEFVGFYTGEGFPQFAGRIFIFIAFVVGIIIGGDDEKHG